MPRGRQSAEPLWRAIAVFRFAGLGYAVLLTAVINRAAYSRLDWAWAVIAAMTAWTVGTTMAYARPEQRTRLLLTADLAVTAGLLLSTAALQYPSALQHGVMPVTGIWVAGPVLAWAVQYGRRAGAIAALILSGCDFLLRNEAITVALNGLVLLLLAGVVVGHLARLAAEVETERQHAIEVEAASRERDRLARDIHDSVLQVLAMVQRRGAEAGGEAAELGRLAGQQEAALRSLVGTGAAASPSGDVDLRALVLPIQSDQVTVSAPAESVRLEKEAAGELTAAIRAALDNVRRHCGERARAWVLVEDEPGLVTATGEPGGVRGHARGPGLGIRPGQHHPGHGGGIGRVRRALWRRTRAVLQHLAVFASLAVLAGTVVARLDPGLGAWGPGLAIWALSVLWGVAVMRGYLPPGATGYFAAGIGVLAGAQLTMQVAAGYALALATVAGLLAAGVLLRQAWLVVLGALGVLLVTPQITTRYLPVSAATPVAIFVAGVVLLGSAVWLARRRAGSGERPSHEHVLSGSPPSASPAGNPARTGSPDTLLRTLAELHADGWAHSIEVWLGDTLVGARSGSASAASSAETPCSAGIRTEDYLPLLGYPAERITLPSRPQSARRLLGPG